MKIQSTLFKTSEQVQIEEFQKHYKVHFENENRFHGSIEKEYNKMFEMEHPRQIWGLLNSFFSFDGEKTEDYIFIKDLLNSLNF